MTGTRALSVGVHYEPSGVDPQINAAELGLQMTMGVFDTLVVMTPDGRFLPHLAESWEISPDERTYRFHLRKDVRFHDGTAFDAGAVKHTLDRARDPANKSQLAGSMLGPYRRAEVVDDYTLALYLEEPYAALLESLSQGWLAPVSPAAARRLGADFRLQPVGTGPFIFDEWKPGKHIRLRRNPDYGWPPPGVINHGPALLDEVAFVFLPGDADRVAALESGEVNAVFYVPPSEVARLRGEPAYTVETWPIRGAPVCMMMNMAKAPTNELVVRRAINHAIDQAALVKQVFHGEFAAARGPLSQYTLGYDKGVEAMYPYDPALARALLAEAGWVDRDGDGVREKDGQRLSVVFYALPVNFYPEFGRFVSECLAQIGAAVEVRVVPAGEWMRAADAGEHHLVPQGKYASSPHILSYIYHSRASNARYGWTKRPASCCPELDRLLEQGERALAVEEYVPLYERVQRLIMEQALIVPLHCNTNIVAVARGITGLAFDAIGAYPLLHDVRIDGVAA